MLSRQCVRRASSVARQIQPEQVTKTSSGLTVASKDQHGPLSHLVLTFRAGSRYEDAQKRGLVHHIKNYVGRDTKDYGGVPLTWAAHSIGAHVNSFVTRDLYGVRITVPRDQTNVALSILGYITAAPAFKPWELEEIRDTLVNDIAYQQPFDIIFDDVHVAAYRNGPLSRSVIAHPSKIGKLNVTDFEKFAADNLVTGKGVLFGLNVEHEHLLTYGDRNAPISHGQGASASSSPYKGGEQRREAVSKYAHVVIAGEGASASDVKAVATQTVLLSALGKGTTTKYPGTNGNGVVSKAVSSFGATYAFQAPYEGSGLVGIYLVTEPHNAQSAVHAVVNALKHISFSDIIPLKAQAKLDILRARAHSADAAVDRAAQLSAGIADGAIISAIEQVSARDVEAAAKKLVSNLSIASYGSVENVPYRDQL